MVKGDMNNAASLINHKLMDESPFLEEYWWIILRCWDNVKGEVYKRRGDKTGALSYMRNMEELDGKAVKYAKTHFKKDWAEYEKLYRPKNEVQVNKWAKIMAV